LGGFLDGASRGERIVIERKRKPVAVLLPIEDARRLEPDEQQRIARKP
jgi:prevent-host-death family protein